MKAVLALAIVVPQTERLVTVSPTQGCCSLQSKTQLTFTASISAVPWYLAPETSIQQRGVSRRRVAETSRHVLICIRRRPRTFASLAVIVAGSLSTGQSCGAHDAAPATRSLVAFVTFELSLALICQLTRSTAQPSPSSINTVRIAQLCTILTYHRFIRLTHSHHERPPRLRAGLTGVSISCAS